MLFWFHMQLCMYVVLIRLVWCQDAVQESPPGFNTLGSRITFKCAKGGKTGSMRPWSRSRRVSFRSVPFLEKNKRIKWREVWLFPFLFLFHSEHLGDVLCLDRFWKTSMCRYNKSLRVARDPKIHLSTLGIWLEVDAAPVEHCHRT